MSEIPPPIPPKLPNEPTPQKTSAEPSMAGAKYDRIADTVGLVPNLRKKDNLYQAICVLVFLVIGLAVGWFWAGWPNGILLGALAGIVLGGLLSGFVLMVLGLVRKS